jgi:hypothetical protein
VSVKTLILAEHKAHTCNPSYLGGTDQEDISARPAWAKKLERPHLNQ